MYITCLGYCLVRIKWNIYILHGNGETIRYGVSMVWSIANNLEHYHFIILFWDIWTCERQKLYLARRSDLTWCPPPNPPSCPFITFLSMFCSLNEYSSYQVNDNITAKMTPPLRSYLTDIHNGLWIISIDMKDWGIDHSGHISAVRRRAGYTWVSGKSNLKQKISTSWKHIQFGQYIGNSGLYGNPMAAKDYSTLSNHSLAHFISLY